MYTVTNLTRSVTHTVITKLFKKYLSIYGNSWSNRHKTESDWNDAVYTWLDALKDFHIMDLRKAYSHSLLVYKDFPPTLGQLLNLCLKESGVPRANDLMRLLVNKDFSHPIVKLMYDKIGSWKLANGTEKELCQKVSEHYDNAVIEFKNNPEVSWQKLESHKAQLSLEAPIPDKMSSRAESNAYKDCMDGCRRLLNSARENSCPIDIPKFDKSKINKGGEQYDEYCKYLLSIPDNLIFSLPPIYAYDRQCLLNTKNTARYLREVGYNPHSKSQNIDKRTSAGAPTKIYKAWMND